MPATSDGRGFGRPKAAIDDSHDGVVINSERKPPAQQRDSSLSSAARSEGVQSTLTQKTNAQATSTKERPSKDVYTQGSKRVKRNRKAEGLPPSYCFECEEEHPLPDEDGTTHHTRSRNKKHRRETDEPARESTTVASEDLGQQPRNHVIEALNNDPPFREAFQTEIREADSDAQRLGKMMTMFNETRAQGERLLAGRASTPPANYPPAPASSADSLATLVSLYNGHNYYATPPLAPVQYQNPSHPVWPSKPPRGGRGRGSGHSGPNKSNRGSQRPSSGKITTPDAADNAVQRPAANTAARATNNVAQTGPLSQSQSATQAAQSGRRKRFSRHNSGPAGVATGRGSHRGRGRGGGASA